MRTLILNSTQSKHPVGHAYWVRATLRAVDETVRQGHELVASLGTIGWEVVLWRAGAQGASIHLVCPIERRTDRDERMSEIVGSFDLPAERVRWHWVPAPGRGRKAGWFDRDRAAVALAERIVPVSLRPHGRLASLIAESGALRIDDYAVPYAKPSPGLRWEHRAPRRVANLWPRGSLVHLTRASDGPWPGEPPHRFYADVARSTGAYARSGFETLCRIVRERWIRGSTFRAWSGVQRVSFTAARAPDVLDFVRFRARYARYAFEPYAIAIRRRAARRLGAKPVTYEARPSPHLFHQGAGRNGHWQREQEWRVPGDVDLGEIDTAEITIVTATEAEARALARWCPYRVRTFGYADARTKTQSAFTSFGAIVAS